MRVRVRSRLSVIAGVVVLLLTLAAAPASAISGNQQFLVVLCNFTGNTAQPLPPSYFDRMYGGIGNGKLGAWEYWRDISYGNFSISTTVKGWYTIPETRSEWAGLGRDGPDNVWSECIEAADPDVDFTQYTAALAVFPEAASTLAAAINMTATTLTVASVTAGNAANFPTPPFPATIDNGNGGNAEGVTVTAISGTTFTVTRGGTPLNHPAGARIIAAGDLYGFGPELVNLNGNIYTLGGLILAHDIGLSVATHEMGHSFDMDHSRRLSSSTTDYNDCWDLMSVITCTYRFTSANTATDEAFGGSSFGGTTKGPGLTAFYLEANGWLDTSRVLNYITTAGCNQSTYLHAALNHPEVAGNLNAKIPATITVATPPPSAMAPPGSATSDFYYLELRSKSGWDRAIPADAFVLHLRAGGVIHLVDNGGALDGLTAGEFYADPAESRYFLVNRIRPANFDGNVTISNCKIVSQADYNGPTTADTTDSVTLAGTLAVTSGSPIPNAPVTLHVGSQFCNATTDAEGDAACNVTLSQPPGVVTAKIEYTGNAAVNGITATDNFTITRESAIVTYSGATTSDYHDAFIASATVIDDDPTPNLVVGKTITFTLGTLSTDTCNDVTDATGSASCSITPNQPAGSVDLVSSFAGDTFYEPGSDTDDFVITQQETTLEYTGPTAILVGASGVTLSARLLEEGVVPPIPFGQTVALGLGGQGCAGSVDAAGNASCTLVYTGALGPQPLTASFAGDAYYEPSSDPGDTAIVFAFPARGAFTIGDITAAAATPTTRVTYWSSQWAKSNSLSGGGVPSTAKGFASTIPLPASTPPAVCAGNWTTGAGGSSDPAGTVPSYMGVVVTSKVTKSGSTIAGDAVKIVVVKTDAGHGAAPGNTGTGVIVATFCG